MKTGNGWAILKLTKTFMAKTSYFQSVLLLKNLPSHTYVVAMSLYQIKNWEDPEMLYNTITVPGVPNVTILAQCHVYSSRTKTPEPLCVPMGMPEARLHCGGHLAGCSAKNRHVWPCVGFCYGREQFEGGNPLWLSADIECHISRRRTTRRARSEENKRVEGPSNLEARKSPRCGCVLILTRQ